MSINSLQIQSTEFLSQGNRQRIMHLLSLQVTIQWQFCVIQHLIFDNKIETKVVFTTFSKPAFFDRKDLYRTRIPVTRILILNLNVCTVIQTRIPALGTVCSSFGVWPLIHIYPLIYVSYVNFSNCLYSKCCHKFFDK